MSRSTMKKTSKTIVFFGSGPVAAASLGLLARDFEVEAVITKPRPPHHRHDFPVLALAEKLDLDTLTASTTEEISRLFEPGRFKGEIGVIIDHGIILAPDVINYFPFGIVNSHFSLLPLWKGPDPISFAILNGDRKTGVSLMLIAEKLDEGLLIAQQSMGITPEATTPDLTDELIALSHGLLVETLPAYMDGRVKPYPQPDIKPSYSHKISKSDGVLDWSKPAERLEREVRAYAGWPKSRTRLGSTDVVITRAAVADDALGHGEIKADGKRLLVGTGKDSLEILELIPAGRRKMTAQAFLAGHKL